MAAYITIERHEGDERIERYLQKKFPHISYHDWQKFFRKKEFKINGKTAKKGDMIYHDDTVKIPPILTVRPSKKPHYSMDIAEARQLLHAMLLDETQDFIVINKPAGLAVQGGTKTTRHIDGLLQVLQPEQSYHLVHRLDKDTSGVMLIAKGRENARELHRLFRYKKITKIYDSLTHHTPNNKQKGVITLPLISHKGFMTIDEEHGIEAETLWNIHQKCAHCYWLKMQPITGRKHQLRAHLAAYNCAIIGDTKYNKTSDIDGDHLQLHAASIQLYDGYQCTAPRPDYMDELINR